MNKHAAKSEVGDLSGFRTKELVEELLTREGVEDAGFFEPGQEFEIKGSGHASILVVRD